MDFGSSPGRVGAVCSSKNRTNGSKKKMKIDEIDEKLTKLNLAELFLVDMYSVVKFTSLYSILFYFALVFNSKDRA